MLAKARNTHSEHVILFAFSWQQTLCEGAQALGCTYIACLADVWPYPEDTRGRVVNMYRLMFFFIQREKLYEAKVWNWQAEAQNFLR